LENLTWIRFLDEDGDEGETEKEDKNGSKKNLRKFVIGITPIYSYLSGKVTDLKLKEVNTLVQKNKSVASFSSIKHFGTVRSPLAGKIIEINMDLTRYPKLVNDSPFGKGWIAKVETNNETAESSGGDKLKRIQDCRHDLVEQIKKYNVKCFKAFPDYQMFELGTECSATLAKLDEFMGKSMHEGDVIRLVSDDPTADLELMSWANRNKQEIIEIVKEKNPVAGDNQANSLLFNIIIKKI
jgi:glycine cleavage system H lipoate-binding protein/TusA-related sulfurtransferase